MRRLKLFGVIIHLWIALLQALQQVITRKITSHINNTQLQKLYVMSDVKKAAKRHTCILKNVMMTRLIFLEGTIDQ